MFKIMTTKSFNAAVEREMKREMANMGQGIRQLRLDKQMLEAEITAMRPDYELGKKRREQYAKDNVIRKERRAVARTQNPTVRAINEQTEVLNRSLAKMLKTAKEIS